MKKILYLSLCFVSGMHASGGLLGSAVPVGSTPKVTLANAYKVEPEDKSPKQSYNDIRNMMQKLATKGYTQFGPWSDGYINTKLKEQGSYGSNGSYSPGRASSAIKRENYKVLNESIYKINQKELVKAIQNGNLFETGSMLQNRLLIQEFYLGQLSVSMPAISNSKLFSGTDKETLTSIKNDLQSTFKQTRYMRNALNRKAEVDSSTFTIGVSKSFSPVDFIVGVIVINESTTSAIKSNTIGIKPGGIGFLPLKSNIYMNNWTNVAKKSQTGLPSREPIQLGQLSNKSHEILFSPSEDLSTTIISFAGQTYLAPESPEAKKYSGKKNIKYFAKGQMTKFFKDLGPWAVVIKVPANETPFITNIVKMNVIDYGKHLKMDGSLVGTGVSTQTLMGIVNAPYNIYENSVTLSPSVGKRLKSDSYPQGHYWAQGMLNGLLETSKYQMLTYNNNELFDNAVSVALTIPRETLSPSNVLAYNSGVDSLFLRAFRITKAALSLSDITQNLLDDYVSGKPRILQVLKNPTKSILTGGKYTYIGAKGSYLPIISVLDAKISPIQKVSVPTTSKVSKLVKSSKKLVPTTSKVSKLVKSSEKPVSKASKVSKLVKFSEKPVSKASKVLNNSFSAVKHKQFTPLNVSKKNLNVIPQFSMKKKRNVIKKSYYKSQPTSYLQNFGHQDSGFGQQQSSGVQQGAGNVSNMSPFEAYKKGYKKGQADSRDSGNSVQQSFGVQQGAEDVSRMSPSAAYKKGYRKGQSTSSSYGEIQGGYAEQQNYNQQNYNQPSYNQPSYEQQSGYGNQEDGSLSNYDNYNYDNYNYDNEDV